MSIAIDLKLNKPTEKKYLNLPSSKIFSPSSVFSEFSQSTHVQLDFNYMNEFLNTIMTSYNYHLPLHLSPDDILIAINSIISQYISYDPERFRHLFVNHEGKRQLSVCVDNLWTDEKGTLYDKVIDEFAFLVKQNIKDDIYVDNAECNFSTSSHIEKTVSYAQVLDMTKHYFQFIMYSTCGIPKVILHGTEEDWFLLKKKVMYYITFFHSDILKHNALSNYLDVEILPIINNLILSRGGKPNRDWWSRIIDRYQPWGSGGSDTEWTGWIIRFFPDVYTESFSEETIVHISVSNKLDCTTNGLTNVEFEFEGKELSLVAGFHGVFQHPDSSVEVIRGYSLEEGRGEGRGEGKEKRKKRERKHVDYPPLQMVPKEREDKSNLTENLKDSEGVEEPAEIEIEPVQKQNKLKAFFKNQISFTNCGCNIL